MHKLLAHSCRINNNYVSLEKQINNNNMKKVILVAVLAMAGLTSCKKDDIKPNVPVEEIENCNCGTVIQIIDEGMVMGNGYAKLWTDYKIKNNCTGKVEKRTFWKYSNEPKQAPNVMDIICN